MKRLIYISDNRYYKDASGNWYSDGIFPKELQEVFYDIDEWVFYGRLTELPQRHNKYLIQKGNNIKQLKFVGLWNTKSGAKTLLKNTLKQAKILKKEIRASDVVYLKFNYFSSYLSTLFPITWKKYTISHMVGDLDCIQYIYNNPLIYFVVSIRSILYKRATNKLNLQIFVSNKLKNKYCNKKNNAIVICENRIRKNQIQNCYNINKNGLNLLFVGRLSKEKGIDILLNAISNLNNVFLTIVGEGDQQESLRILVHDLGLDERVNFLGSVKWGISLFEQIKKSDGLVLPSYSEGLPLVLVEAMSYGVPVIATNVGGIPEIVKNGKNGLLCKSGNIDSLREAIIKFEKCDRKKLSRNAIVTAKTYSLDAMNEKLLIALKNNEYIFKDVVK